MSNKQNGLFQAVEDVHLQMAHAFYMKHMKANLKQAFNDAIHWIGLWTVAISYNVCMHDAAL